jgi:hypothetical protein
MAVVADVIAVPQTYSFTVTILDATAQPYDPDEITLTVTEETGQSAAMVAARNPSGGQVQMTQTATGVWVALMTFLTAGRWVPQCTVSDSESTWYATSVDSILIRAR